MSWPLRMAAAAALTALIAALWLAGPMIGFGDVRPLEPAWVRAVSTGVLLVGFGTYWIFRFLQIRHSHEALIPSARSGANGGDAPELQTRMAEAVARHRRARGKRGLREIPWYLVIGPPGSGKTTALANSGLKFPFAGPEAGDRTQICDWWFAEDAVLVDTPGRYTTQGGDPRSDNQSWLALLSLLKRHRGQWPIDGVILTCSLEDLMILDDQGLGAHVVAIGNRLQEIEEHLQSGFPVYVLFTKADLVAGFVEYFGSFDQDRRHKVWGTTFDAGENLKTLLKQIPAEFEALAGRLAEEATDRLQEERDSAARIALFAFPARFGLLRERVTGFLRSIFERGKHGEDVKLRGFYFSSATQKSPAIDQVLQDAAGGFARVNVPAHASKDGEGFFLNDLLSKVIFAEAGRILQDRFAARRAATLRYGGLAAIALVAAGALGMLGWSYSANSSLIALTDESVEDLRHGSEQLLASTTVADADLENVITVLQTLRYLPAGFETRDLRAPMHETFGLSQRERLRSASITAYRQALERMFRSRLLLQLERTIGERMVDPIELYEPLKVYLMLGGQAPKVDDVLIVAWMRRDWEENRYPGSSNREGRLELEKHLRAMLELDDGREPSFALNRSLVEAAQRSLGRLTLAERARALIRSAIYSAGLEDFSLAAGGGPEAGLVFETVDGNDVATLTVPGLYTYEGFNSFYLPQLAGVAQKLTDDHWVIGDGGEQGMERELPRLGPELLARYGRDFGDAWNAVLNRLKFKSLSADGPQYLALSAAAASDSPLKRLFEAVASETALARAPSVAANGEAAQETAERAKGLARIGIQLPTSKSQNRAGAAFSGANQLPGASVEAQFRPYHAVVSGPPGQRPIDVLVHNLHDIHQSLQLAAAVPGQAERANANLQLQISSLRTNASRLPKAMSRMVHEAADEFEGDAAETSIAKLNQMLQETVTDPCQATIDNRYPFAKGSTEDVPLADFVRMFAPNGVMDRFFAQHVAPLTDLSSQTWQWKQGTRLGRELSVSALKAFQLAAEIRDAFFPPGASAPAVDITFTPVSLNSDAEMALLDVDGQLLQSYQSGSVPGTVTWPGSGMSSGSANLSLTPELPGRESAVRFQGPWALKRLFDTASITRKEDAVEAQFVIGGRDIAYSITTRSSDNPFLLPALSNFRCPAEF
ncbi:type VI secretion system membrane subunit TssM [Chelativorans salis]|nr:type VI secretion system membrane subunit TssM [Chelativorans sp. EGI FJ00035]